MLLAVTHAVAYQRKSVLREKQALAAETRLAEARLMALQAQLHPHFLFNTLNAISSMVYDKPSAADAMICALSELLRRVLQASTKREVSLKDEIALARSYVAIQQVRFGDALEVIWDLPEATSQAAVPTLLLQPLIENAVVHAVEAENGHGKIVVRAEKSGEQLNLMVQDTGSSVQWSQETPSQEKSTGIGLSNTRARLAELYGENHLFRFTQEPGAGAKVEISIPFRQI
jgi:LytS/YehU family sensor histidine kinase